jgi:hypothetical protein
MSLQFKGKWSNCHVLTYTALRLSWERTLRIDFLNVVANSLIQATQVIDYSSFENYTPDLPRSTIRSEIEESFSLWTSVSGMSVQEVSNLQEADLPILFGAREHGDCRFPFDGPGKNI